MAGIDQRRWRQHLARVVESRHAGWQLSGGGNICGQCNKAAVAANAGCRQCNKATVAGVQYKRSELVRGSEQWWGGDFHTGTVRSAASASSRGRWTAAAAATAAATAATASAAAATAA